MKRFTYLSNGYGRFGYMAPHTLNNRIGYRGGIRF